MINISPSLTVYAPIIVVHTILSCSSTTFFNVASEIVAFFEVIFLELSHKCNLTSFLQGSMTLISRPLTTTALYLTPALRLLRFTRTSATNIPSFPSRILLIRMIGKITPHSRKLSARKSRS